VDVQLEREDAAASATALDMYFASHQAHEFATDGKAWSRTARRPEAGIAYLFERPKVRLQTRFFYADSRVVHGET
jgi:hypothetical protein